MSHFPVPPLLFTALALGFLSPLPLAAPSTHAATGSVRIHIEQVSPYASHDAFGAWSLILPGNSRIEMKANGGHTREQLPAGHYTFLVDPLAGTTAKVTRTVNGETAGTFDLPQISFDAADGDDILLTVEFVFVRTGNVAVSSEPLGLSFTLKGPNASAFRDTTPASFLDVVEGLYTVYFDAIEECITPRPLSQRLVKDSRVNFSVTIACENIDRIPQQEAKTLQFEFVTVATEDGTITFGDTPTSAWFAPFVAQVARSGILTGYRDGAGKPTGTFGVQDEVTLAQLAKIAHKVTGIHENTAGVEPRNTRARNQWFAAFYASAEKQHWEAFQDQRTDPNRPATRAEVVATLLQALDVPRVWPKGALFRDVTPATRFAASIETAATDELASGYTDRNGQPTGEFGPERPINRAEMAKIVTLAIELYRATTAEIQGESQ